MLTPDLFGGIPAILEASSLRMLKLDERRMTKDDYEFADRAYALLVQSIIDPQSAEAIIAECGSSLNLGRLLPAMGGEQRKTLARLMFSVPAGRVPA